MKDYIKPVVTPLIVNMEGIHMKSGQEEEDDPNVAVCWGGHDGGSHSVIFVVAKTPNYNTTGCKITLEYIGLIGGFKRDDVSCDKNDGYDLHAKALDMLTLGNEEKYRPVYVYDIKEFWNSYGPCNNVQFGLGPFWFYDDTNGHKIEHDSTHAGAYMSGGTAGDSRDFPGVLNSTAHYVVHAKIEWY